MSEIQNKTPFIFHRCRQQLKTTPLLHQNIGVGKTKQRCCFKASTSEGKSAPFDNQPLLKNKLLCSIPYRSFLYSLSYPPHVPLQLFSYPPHVPLQLFSYLVPIHPYLPSCSCPVHILFFFGCCSVKHWTTTGQQLDNKRTTNRGTP